MRLIVTRPEPEANRTARALIRLGHTAILSPVLDIEPTKAKLPDADFQAVLVTSSNAVRALAGHREQDRLRDAKVLAVGDQSALEAKRAGFARARSAGGAAGDLVALAARILDPAAGPLLYAAGEEQSADIASALQEKGFAVETAVLYRSKARARLSGVAADALRGAAVDGVLLYSRRSADAFASALKAEGLAPIPPEIACFCLSANVAEPLAAVTSGPVRVAARPDQLSLFAEIERYSRSAVIPEAAAPADAVRDP
jgi:uroporphyrinogen-III synthase